MIKVTKNADNKKINPNKKRNGKSLSDLLAIPPAGMSYVLFQMTFQ